MTTHTLNLEATLVPSTRDLGDGFKVRRALPSIGRRMIGPFVFLDEMGPVTLAPGSGLDVRPHPHIGLATVTYLFDGEILDQDSLGVRQPIRPGDVNWMIAGSGIVHSEQSWLALPEGEEERAPSFRHHAADELPRTSRSGVSLRVIAGEMFGLRSPVETLSPTFYVDVTLEPGAELAIAPDYEERGAYIVDGSVTVDGQDFDRGRLLVFKPKAQVLLSAKSRARLMLLGGETLGPRHVWWNFVSSSRERIEQAKADWKTGRFGAVPGDSEFIPLPEEHKPRVDYP